jgi:hypothetical protein
MGTDPCPLTSIAGVLAQMRSARRRRVNEVGNVAILLDHFDLSEEAAYELEADRVNDTVEYVRRIYLEHPEEAKAASTSFR